MTPGARTGAGLVAIVPAAGAGSRMGGRPKAFLSLPCGETFIERIARTCREAGVEAVVCVLAPGVEGAVPAGVAVARNPDPSRGMGSSIAVGLAHEASAGARGYLLWPVDCPRVGAPVLLRLAEEWRRTGAPVVIPCSGGRRGHPALFDGALRSALQEAPLDRGVRAVLAAYERRIAHVDMPPGSGILDDFDTPADLAAGGL